MDLQIPSDVEAAIQTKAIASGFQSVEEYILDRLGLDSADVATQSSPEEWLKQFDALVSKQTSRNPNFDDSRNGIYPVR